MLFVSIVSRRTKQVLQITFIGLLFIGLAFSSYIIEWFNLLLQDPELFTGRGTIWSAVVQAINENFWLGIGYGAVWSVGDDAYINQFVSNRLAWFLHVSHGHNGYLDTFLSIGIIGFFSTMWVLIIVPISKLLDFEDINKSEYFFCASFFMFFVFHNILETNILLGDSNRWLVFLIVYFICRSKLVKNN
ncbi:O-antigen ligase family protein [Colwellia sp. MSW7]|uniref:O-antigen ligase family protein n=1 Tax=Colwellia maritima TaxID=2912588 RepID=A0ABS9X5H3_9GAMM|nr:O-antigen ligase family protein [Colwellia maritima]MCI2285478.1 O-antigen ligase family protein [Colwellia maritima]